MFTRRPTSTLAIDLAPDAVRMLEVQFKKDVPHVTAMGSEALPAGNNENLPERHLAALSNLVNTHRLKSRRCIATLPTNLVVTRSMAIDPAKLIAPPEQIRLMLQNTLSRDSQDLLFDFWQVGETGKNRQQEVLVVATQLPIVNRYLEGFTKLRLACAHLDVSPCALSSLVTRMTQNPQALTGTVVLSENIGYFAVIEREKVLFWRPFDLPQHSKSVSVIQAGLDRIGDEISKCVSHMVGSQHLDNLSELFLFGHGSNDESFVEYLTNRFGLAVRSPSPFDLLPAGAVSGNLHGELEAPEASHYAAVLGLALQPRGVMTNG